MRAGSLILVGLAAAGIVLGPPAALAPLAAGVGRTGDFCWAVIPDTQDRTGATQLLFPTFQQNNELLQYDMDWIAAQKGGADTRVFDGCPIDFVVWAGDQTDYGNQNGHSQVVFARDHLSQFQTTQDVLDWSFDVVVEATDRTRTSRICDLHVPGDHEIEIGDQDFGCRLSGPLPALCFAPDVLPSPIDHPLGDLHQARDTLWDYSAVQYPQNPSGTLGRYVAKLGKAYQEQGHCVSYQDDDDEDDWDPSGANPYRYGHGVGVNRAHVANLGGQPVLMLGGAIDPNDADIAWLDAQLDANTAGARLPVMYFTHYYVDNRDFGAGSPSIGARIMGRCGQRLMDGDPAGACWARSPLELDVHLMEHEEVVFVGSAHRINGPLQRYVHRTRPSGYDMMATLNNFQGEQQGGRYFVVYQYDASERQLCWETIAPNVEMPGALVGPSTGDYGFFRRRDHPNSSCTQPGPCECTDPDKNCASGCIDVAWWGMPEAAVCGNGALEAGELCDDGNLLDDDGCTSECITEVCGDSVLNTGIGEECDDGNAVGRDGCSELCETEAVLELHGSALGGSLSFEVDGVPLALATAAGQTAAEVTAAMAAAVNGNATLMALGTTASAEAAELAVNSFLTLLALDDAGLSLLPIVNVPEPGQGWLLGTGLAALGGLGWARRRRGSKQPAGRQR